MASETAPARPADAVTVRSALLAAARALAGSSETPRLDAELLLGHVLGLDRARLTIDSQARLDTEMETAFAALVDRRGAGEPVAYLIGRRAFRTLELTVDRRVLLPRPETEELVDAALAELPQGASVLDVGTGSGAIALALAAERGDLRVTGLDVSDDALAVARANAQRLSLDVSFIHGDLLDGAEPVDAVVANLPYVEDEAPLPIDVAGYEPALALFGGAGDGLGLIRRLAGELAVRSSWPRSVLLEIGERQGPSTVALLRDAGFGDVELRADLGGRDRIVIGRRDLGDR